MDEPQEFSEIKRTTVTDRLGIRLIGFGISALFGWLAVASALLQWMPETHHREPIGLWLLHFAWTCCCFIGGIGLLCLRRWGLRAFLGAGAVLLGSSAWALIRAMTNHSFSSDSGLDKALFGMFLSLVFFGLVAMCLGRGENWKVLR